MSGFGGVNAWKCQICKGLTVAVHVDSGTTPMMIGCKAHPAAIKPCPGLAQSLMYAVTGEMLEKCEWQWRDATKSELKRWRHSNIKMYQHCRMGGLVLEPIDDRGRATLETLKASA